MPQARIHETDEPLVGRDLADDVVGRSPVSVGDDVAHVRVLPGRSDPICDLDVISVLPGCSRLRRRRRGVGSTSRSSGLIEILVSFNRRVCESISPVHDSVGRALIEDHAQVSDVRHL